jgi:hypothetical protein
MQLYFIGFKQFKWILISLLIIAGCVPVDSTQPASQATETQYQADLTAVESSVKVYKEDAVETEVPEGENVNVGVKDRIEVDGGSRAIMKFADFLDIELFRNAQIRLTDVKLEPGGGFTVNLNQIQGHVGISLNAQSPARVTLETSDAVIKTLENGTEFIVCAAPGKITCVAVLKGSIEVTGQGEKKITKAGNANYIRTGEAPVTPVCAPESLFMEWREQMRASADTPTISNVVFGLPQRPCISKMVKIMGGTYEIGSMRADEFHSAVRNIELADFWIDMNEVTNIQYQQYLDQTSSPPPLVWPGDWGHPVRGMTWDQAAGYCGWANKRLPTEAEWEVAGRGSGPNAPLYPWGDDPQASGEITGLPLEETYSVETFTFNVSPFGVYDMAGNVWEWVDEPYDSAQEGYRVLRGGRFGLIKDLAHRELVRADDERYVPYAGIRCAASQMEAE